MNDNDIAMACKKDTKHLIQNGKDGFDVTLVLCSDRFKIISQKNQNSGFFFFSVHLGTIMCHDSA